MISLKNEAPAFFVIKDLKTKSYVMNRRTGCESLNDCLARYARVVGAQKDISAMESRGIDCTKMVIVGVHLSEGEVFTPKTTAQKSGWVVKFTTVRPDYWKPSKKVTEVKYLKGNKAKNPRSVDERVAELKADADAHGYTDRNEPWKVKERLESALWSAWYDATRSMVDTALRASIFPTREAAEAYWEHHRQNLVRYMKEYKGREKGRVGEKEKFTAKVTIEQV